MGIITGISPQVHNRDRYNLFVDGAFLCGMNAESIVKYHLKVGAEVDAAALCRAIFESDCTDAFSRGADLLGKGRKTEAEMRRYLLDKGYSAEVADFTVEKLRSYRYVDDGEWLDAYFGFHAQGKGVFRIRQDLRRHGIPDDLAEERLAAFCEDLDEAIALGKKFLRGKALDRKARAALWRHLAGKGYTRETIAAAAAAIFGEAEDTDGSD